MLDISLFETLILFDNLIYACCFLKNYIMMKLQYNQDVIAKQHILDNYNNIYKISSINRYLCYLIFHLINLITFSKFYFLFYIFILPFIQNNFLKINFIKKHYYNFVLNQNILIKYSLSKSIIEFIKNLHKDINDISNYHIFLIYKEISFKNIYNISKIYIFISLLHFLKKSNRLYYYYKAIKMAYYHQFNYNFNELSIDIAINILNIIIKEKRWNEIHKEEVINAIYTIISYKYNTYLNYFISIKILSLKILSIWTLIVFLKVFWIFAIYFYILVISYIILFYPNKKKNTLISILVYFLIYLNINDIFITILIILNNLFFYCCQEIIFFFKYNSSIKQVLKKNNEKNFIII